MMILKLARRNIWRNKRRTLITATSIMFAVFFATAMNSFQTGAWDGMIFTVVNSYYGFGQIHQKGYWDEKTLDNALPYEETIKQLEGKHSQVLDYVPRLESYSLISVGEKTKVGLVIGVEPEKEDNLSNLKSKLVEGEYFNANDKAVIISDTLAKELGIGIGDTIALSGLGYHGANAADLYPIKGLISVPVASLRQMVYLPFKESQILFGAEGMATTLVIRAKNPHKIKSINKALATTLDTTQYEIMNWEEMMPEIIEAKQAKTGGSKIMFGVLYLIIGFGIFGTILMMVKEREYEFGVLTAIGMKRHKLGIMIWLETLFMGLLGIVSGMLLSFPIIYYFNQNPIDIAALSEDAVSAYEEFGVPTDIPFSMNPSIFLNEAIVVFVILTILAIYPFFKIKNLKPVEAMRH